MEDSEARMQPIETTGIASARAGHLSHHEKKDEDS